MDQDDAEMTSQPKDNIETMEQQAQSEPMDIDKDASTTNETDMERPASKTSKYNSPAKSCPFPGCDGSGNIKPNSNVHFSLNFCPIAREEKKRERELLVRKNFIFISMYWVGWREK